MIRRIRIAVVTLAVVLMVSGTLSADTWPTAPWPGWSRLRDVDEVAASITGWEARRRALVEHGGFHYWLFDTSLRMDPAGTTSVLYREVIELHNEKGLDQIGDLTVTFVPTEERLLLVHLRRRAGAGDPWEDLDYRVRLERAGKVQGMYVDEQTVAFIPKRLGPHDQIDLAYVVVGRSSADSWDWVESDSYPAFVGSRKLTFQFPRGIEPTISSRGFAMPRETTTEEGLTLEWEAANLEPAVVEEWIPDSFDPFRTLSLSTAVSWADLNARYAARVAAFPISTEVSDLARRLSASSGQVARDLAAWVQGNIRYVGIETASHRLTPTDPIATLERGYGDCKDMSLLLVQMLRSRGVDAWPVMVRTPELGPVDPTVPMLSAFNHEIVAFSMDGSLVFVDPTIKEAVPPWSGALREGARVLVVDGTSGLTEVGPQPDSRDSVVSRVVARSGGDGLTIGVKTEYRGPSLTAMRRRLLEGTPGELEKDAAGYFAGALEGRALRSNSLDYSAAREARSPMVIAETFNFGEIAREEKCIVRYFPPEIGEWFRHVSVSGRRSPMGLGHPRETRVELSFEGRAGEGLVAPEDWTHDDGFVRISRRSKVGEGKVFTVWEARTLTDVVPVEEVAAFCEGLDRAASKAGVAICPTVDRARASGDSNAEGTIPWKIMALGGTALGLLIGLLVGFVVGRRRRG